MDLEIAGKNALVCAASKGLGRATARALAREGVSLFLCARGEEALRETAREIEAEFGVATHYMACDLSDSDARDALIRDVQATFPQVDILVHNVGGPPPSKVEDTTPEDWEKGFQQLFMSTTHLNRAILPGMKARRWGRIVIITSLAVMEPVANLAVSNGIRAAVTGMAKTLADELAGHSVTVNCVAPGFIHTDRIESLIGADAEKRDVSKEEAMRNFVSSIPAGRLGTPEEFADVVAFLCSQRAAYVTGSTVCVDGGKRRATF